jgi:electron transport complex protein RnfG
MDLQPQRRAEVNAARASDPRSRVGYQGVLLGGMALLASTLLAIAHVDTEDAIAARLAEDRRASLEEVIPAALHDNDLLQDAAIVNATAGAEAATPQLVYRAMLQGQVTAVAFSVVGQGYSGPIELILGLAREGRILGVRVVSHAETPGLGDKVERAKSNWILTFDGRSLRDPTPERWRVKKDGGEFDQLTGATITPRAVVRAVREGLERYAAQSEGFLGEGAASRGSQRKKVHVH